MATNKIKIEVVKYKALQLRKNFQIPYRLAYYIYQLTNDSDIKLVKFLMSQSEHYLRIKGYYKKYPDVERECNALIDKQYLKLLEERP